MSDLIAALQSQYHMTDQERSVANLQAQGAAAASQYRQLGQAAAMDANSHGQALAQYYANNRYGFAQHIGWPGLTTIEHMELDLKSWLKDWDKPAVPRETEG